MTVGSAGREPVLNAHPRGLVIALPGPHDVVSWAIVGGGLRRSERVVWREVRNRDLTPDVDAEALLLDAMSEMGAPGGVGFMTSAPVSQASTSRAVVGDVTSVCVATVGLSNAVAVGTPPTGETSPFRVGTINLLVWSSQSLTTHALLEALSIATEARTAAVLAEGVVAAGSVATGTGTDCIAVAAPVLAGEREALSYAGKHTAVGAAIGRSVSGAMAEGLAAWRARRAS